MTHPSFKLGALSLLCIGLLFDVGDTARDKGSCLQQQCMNSEQRGFKQIIAHDSGKQQDRVKHSYPLALSAGWRW